MNPYKVKLITEGQGECWVEIWKHGEQVGNDIDCTSRRQGLAAAKRECKRLGLILFNELQMHRL